MNRENNKYVHRVNNFRWIYMDDQNGWHTYNIQCKVLWWWHTFKCIESTSREAGREKCEEVLAALTKEY